jgi:hypothetical protein
LPLPNRGGPPVPHIRLDAELDVKLVGALPWGGDNPAAREPINAPGVSTEGPLSGPGESGSEPGL